MNNCHFQKGPTFVRGTKEEPEAALEEEDDSLTDYNEIIRDTGPVASIGTSCATSLAPSDDEDQVMKTVFSTFINP